jgi:hypothetical protein
LVPVDSEELRTRAIEEKTTLRIFIENAPYTVKMGFGACPR